MRAAPEKHHHALATCFLVSSIVCWSFSIFGPFAWTIYDAGGFVYFIALEILLYVGLRLGWLSIGGRRQRTCVAKGLTQAQKKLLLLLSTASVFACIYEITSFLSYYGLSYVAFSGAYYEFAEEGRSAFDKILLFVMQFGMASYLILKAYGVKLGRIGNALAVAGFWTTAAYYILQGSRFTTVVALIVFVAINHRKHDRASVATRLANVRILPAVLAMVLVVGVFYAVAQTTEGRMGEKAAYQHYEFVYGDSPVKPEFQEIAFVDTGVSNALFSMCDYLGEAPYVFTYYWKYYMPDQPYMGANTFRAIGQILNGIGIHVMPSQKEIHQELGGGSGKYSGFGYVMIQDFGVILTPIFALLGGYLLSRIEVHRRENAFCRAVYPCCFSICVFAPIYYYYVGRIDYVILALGLTFALLRLLESSKASVQTLVPTRAVIKAARHE